MGLLRWLFVLPLVGFVLQLVFDRNHFQRSLAAQRRWKDTVRSRSPGERREVTRAVRNGRAVADPRVAGPAMQMAEDIASHPTRTPVRWMADALFATWVLAPMVVAGIRGRWVWMAICSVGPLFFLSLAIWSSRFRVRAAEALEANRRVPPPPPPLATAHDLATSPHLGVGLPRSVARARRRPTDPGVER